MCLHNSGNIYFFINTVMKCLHLIAQFHTTLDNLIPRHLLVTSLAANFFAGGLDSFFSHLNRENQGIGPLKDYDITQNVFK